MWNAFQVILVLRLSLPECTSRGNLSHDFTWPQPRGLHVGDCSFGDVLLFWACIEDPNRTVASNPTLSVPRSRKAKGLRAILDVAPQIAPQTKSPCLRLATLPQDRRNGCGW